MSSLSCHLQSTTFDKLYPTPAFRLVRLHSLQEPRSTDGVLRQSRYVHFQSRILFQSRSSFTLYWCYRSPLPSMPIRNQPISGTRTASSLCRRIPIGLQHVSPPFEVEKIGFSHHLRVVRCNHLQKHNTLMVG